MEEKTIFVYEFAGFSVSDFTDAAEPEWGDFEDDVQSMTAERVHVDYIVTRNNEIEREGS